MTEAPREITSEGRPGHGVKSILRNTAYLLGSRACVFVSKALYAVALARLLGPEQYGVLSYLLAWYLTFVPLGTLGLGPWMSREVGLDRSRGHHVVGQMLGLRGLLSIVAAVVAAIAGVLTENDVERMWLIVIMSTAILGRGLALWAEHTFTAYEQSRFTLQQEGIFRVSEATIGTAVLIAGGGLLGAVVVHIAVWLVQGVRGFWLVRKHVVRVQLEGSWSDYRRLLRIGFPLGLASLLLVWFPQGPLILYRHLAPGAKELGELALLIQVFVILSTVPTLVAAASLPVLSRAAGRRDGRDSLYADVGLRVSAIVAVVGASLGSAYGPVVVRALFGTKYQGTEALIGPSMLLLLPWTWGTLAWYVNLARGRVWSSVGWMLAGAVILVVSIAPLSRNLGIEGVLIAMGAGLSTWAVGQVASMVARTDRNLLASAGSALATTGGALLLAMLVPADAPVSPAAVGLVAFVVLGAALSLVKPVELRAIAGACRSVVGRKHFRR